MTYGLPFSLELQARILSQNEGELALLEQMRVSDQDTLGRPNLAFTDLLAW
jgi:hypothetical protein